MLLGRPYAYGLGIGGEAGVGHVIRALRTDFELTMRMAGFASLADLGPEALAGRPLPENGRGPTRNWPLIGAGNGQPGRTMASRNLS